MQQRVNKKTRVNQKRDSQPDLQTEKQAEGSSNAQTHDSDPLGKITNGVGDEACIAKYVSVIQRTGLFHPMNESQKVRSLLRLQQQYGNRFVQQVIAQRAIQTKLQARQQERKGRLIQRQSTSSTHKNPVTEAVRILKNSPRITNPQTSLDKKLSHAANLLNEEKVLGIFREERERTTGARKFGEKYEIFTETFGKGAVGEPAYKDVELNFQSEKNAFVDIFGAPPSGWIKAVKDENWGVFYSAAYLLLSIARREKPGRTQDDQMKLGMAVYHAGMEKEGTLVQAQLAAAKKLGKDAKDLTWSEIETELRESATGRDIIDYVEGVTTYKNVKFDFTFDVYVQLLGETRFYVGDYSEVKVTSFAEYKHPWDPSKWPADKRPPSTYWIVVGGQKVLYAVGEKQEYTWSNLNPGTYYLRIYNRYTKGDLLLKGKGTVEVKLQ